MSGSAEFFKAGYFDGPIRDFTFCAQIPRFTCSNCHYDSVTNWFNYPHLDVMTVVSKEERKRLGPIMKVKSTDDEIIRIISEMRKVWNVPITAGTILGPTRVKVTSKPKDDLHVLFNSMGFFCRRPAAEKLSREVPIRFVETTAIGKYGAAADYVEIIVPVAGRAQMPVEVTFCEECLRYSPDRGFPTVLIREHIPNETPFFKLLEKGVIVFTGEFVKLIRKLGITGFKSGETLLPVEVVEESSPRPSLVAMEAEAARIRDQKWQKLLEETEARRKGD